MWHSHIGANLPYGFSCACLHLGLTRPGPALCAAAFAVSSGLDLGREFRPCVGFHAGEPTWEKKKKSTDTPVLAWIGVNTRVYLRGSWAPKKVPE